MSWDSEETVFEVVMNDEEQYSIWPAYLDLAPGWKPVGVRGKKTECMQYIDQHWTDLRPRSLREQLAAQARP